MGTGYVALMRRPGAAAFVTAGFVGRLPLSMVSLGVVLLITANGGSYATAGALSASYALAAAFIAPFGARWVDRAGQARAVPVLLAGQIVFLLAFTAAEVLQLATVVQFLLLIAAGGVAPNVGSLVRARWANALRGSAALRSAFALEAVVDEVVFVVGPPLVTTVALALGEAWGLILCCVLFAVGGGWLAAQQATQPPPRPRDHSGHTGRMVTPALVIVVIVLVLMGGVFGSFEVTTVSFTRSLGHEESTGLVLALYAFGSLLAGIALGAATIRASLAQQLVRFAAVLAVVTLPMPFVPSLGLLLVAALLAGLSVSPVLITTVTIVERVVPPARLTEALTVATSGIAVGLAVGSPAAGALVDAVAPDAGYWVMAGCGVAAFVLAAATARLVARSVRSAP